MIPFPRLTRLRGLLTWFAFVALLPAMTPPMTPPMTFPFPKRAARQRAIIEFDDTSIAHTGTEVRFDVSL